MIYGEARIEYRGYKIITIKRTEFSKIEMDSNFQITQAKLGHTTQFRFFIISKYPLNKDFFS